MGTKYTECTSSESSEPWCSTQTDPQGMHVEGKWGVCGQACFEEGCKTAGSEGVGAGKKCRFPFTFEGKTYNECTTAGNDDTLWCATMTDSSGLMLNGQWGNCEEACSTSTATGSTSTDQVGKDSLNKSPNGSSVPKDAGD